MAALAVPSRWGTHAGAAWQTLEVEPEETSFYLKKQESILKDPPPPKKIIY